MIAILKQRWSAEGGYRELLIIAVPLIFSTGSWSLLIFFDRMFLSWYSPEAIAAAVPAGLASFSMLCFFIGTAAYVNTFVAQYFGAKEQTMIGAIIWQGLYFSLFCLLFVVPAYLFADVFFAFIGHPQQVQYLETIYFKTLMYSALFMVMNNVLSSFFSGMGKTIVVMWVNVLIAIINIVLDYLLIFGKLGFPAMGIHGAAIATNIAVISGCLLLLILVFRAQHECLYQVYSGWKFNYRLFRRLIHYGMPNGMRLFIDMSSLTAFLMFMGQIGTRELAISNIAININALSFLPMVGLMIGVSVVVGQRLGEKKPWLAEKATWSGIHIAIIFFGTLALLYLLVPSIFIHPFSSYGELGNTREDRELIIVLLRFIAFFGICDAVFLVFMGALEGAGDTRFIMRMSFLVSLGCLVLPCYLYVQFFDEELLVLWWILTLHVMLYCGVFFIRFQRGRWKDISVIH